MSGLEPTEDLRLHMLSRTAHHLSTTGRPIPDARVQAARGGRPWTAVNGSDETDSAKAPSPPRRARAATIMPVRVAAAATRTPRSAPVTNAAAAVWNRSAPCGTPPD